MKKFLFAVLLLSIGTSVHAQADFYKGKTIRLIIGYSAGGTNDLWARAIARHWGKHIPGNPDFIVQNMPGAATLVAANYIYGVEKPDGLTLGLIAPEGAPRVRLSILYNLRPIASLCFAISCLPGLLCEWLVRRQQFYPMINVRHFALPPALRNSSSGVS